MKGSSESKKKNRFAGVISENYDETIRLICPHLNALEQSVADGLHEIFDKPRMGKPFRVLDLGCGDGLTSISILEKFSEDVELIAVDNEPKMLEQFRTNLSSFESAITLICDDALAYLRNIKPSYFDGVASCFVLHNWDDSYRLDVLREIYRVLHPGGIFVNADKIGQSRPLYEQTLLKEITLILDSYIEANRLSNSHFAPNKIISSLISLEN